VGGAPAAIAGSDNDSAGIFGVEVVQPGHLDSGGAQMIGQHRIVERD
jgi:hypothetical protein